MSTALARPGPARRTFVAALNPGRMLGELWASRGLALQLASREIAQRYKGHTLGPLWLVLQPLIMLAVFTFVFGIVFVAKRQAVGADAKGGGVDAMFALRLYLGLLVFGLFRDVVARAPGLILYRPQFVKKVVMPLHVFSLVDVLVALFTFGVGMAVWLAGWLLFSPQHVPHPTLALLPVLIMPVALCALGLSWLLSALGVFVRDLGNIVEVAVMVLFFLSPVFFSLGDVPEHLRTTLALNPMAQALERCRDAAVAGVAPTGEAWLWWLAAMAAGALIALLGYAVFAKARRAFADVL